MPKEKLSTKEIKKGRVRKPKSGAEVTPEPSSSEMFPKLDNLQQQIGNQAVSRMIQSRKPAQGPQAAKNRQNREAHQQFQKENPVSIQMDGEQTAYNIQAWGNEYKSLSKQQALHVLRGEYHRIHGWTIAEKNAHLRHIEIRLVRKLQEAGIPVDIKKAQAILKQYNDPSIRSMLDELVHSIETLLPALSE